MTSIYLTRSEIPLAVALRQMLENIDAELAGEELEDAEERRLRWRAELIRWLLDRGPCWQAGFNQTRATGRHAQ